ncbi:unnamed protein product [Sphagnum troendelagicum]
MKIGEGPGYEPGCGSVPGTDAWARTGRVSDRPVTNRVVVRFPGPALGHGCQGKKCGASFAQWPRPCSSNSERGRPLLTSSSDNVRDRGDVLQQSKLILGISCMRLLRY